MDRPLTTNREMLEHMQRLLDATKKGEASADQFWGAFDVAFIDLNTGQLFKETRGLSKDAMNEKAMALIRAKLSVLDPDAPFEPEPDLDNQGTRVTDPPRP